MASIAVIAQRRSAEAARPRTAFFTFAAAAAAYGMSTLAGLLVARYTGPPGRGLYNGVAVVVSLAAAFPAGLSSALAYHVIRSRRQLAELSRGFTFLLGASIVLSWCAAAAWSRGTGWNAEVIGFAAAVPASMVVACQQNLYVALGSMRLLNVQVVALALATLLSVIVALGPMHAGAIGALGGWIVANCIVAAAILVHLRAVARTAAPIRFDAALSLLLPRGGVSVLASLVSTLNYRVDALMVIALLGTGPFGVYSVAFGVAEALLLLARAVATAVSREIGGADRNASAALTSRSVRAVTLATGCTALVLFWAMPPLLELVVGKQFDGCLTPLRVLLCGMVALSSNATFAAFFVLQLGRPSLAVGVNAAMATTQAVVCAVLIPRLGLPAAALAASTAYLLGMAMNTMVLCKTSGFSIYDVWAPRRTDFAMLARSLRRYGKAIAPDGPFA